MNWQEESASKMHSQRGAEALKTLAWMAIGTISIIKVMDHADRHGQLDGGLTAMGFHSARRSQ